MDKKEARTILTEHLFRYMNGSYSELVGVLDKQDTLEVTGLSGKRYQLEFLVIWDDEPYRDLRVIASINDGGFRAFFPLTDNFIRGPDEKSVGK